MADSTRRNLLSAVAGGMTLLSGCSATDEAIRVGAKAADDAVRVLGGTENTDEPSSQETSTETPTVHKTFSFRLEYGSIFSTRFQAEAGSVLEIDLTQDRSATPVLFTSDQYTEFKSQYRETKRYPEDGDIDISISQKGMRAELPQNTTYVLAVILLNLGDIDNTPEPVTVDLEYWVYP